MKNEITLSHSVKAEAANAFWDAEGGNESGVNRAVLSVVDQVILGLVERGMIDAAAAVKEILESETGE